MGKEGIESIDGFKTLVVMQSAKGKYSGTIIFRLGRAEVKTSIPAHLCNDIVDFVASRAFNKQEKK